MPELPEVETVKNDLKSKLLGKCIRSVDVLYDGIIAYPTKDEFVNNIDNLVIKDITRRGKFILFKLDDYCLISHLRMEGKYFIKKHTDDINEHDHVIFKLSDGNELRYNDTRKFGKMYLVKSDDFSITPIKDLGLEPWDVNLNINYLRKMFNRNKAIKTLLLDQSIICGIGNIYADEILFLSRIHPQRYGKDLTDIELLDIIKYTKSVMEKSIKLGGTTIHTYTSLNGVSGKNQDTLLVHGKKGNKCTVCDSEIVKIVVNTRGTYYCPNCQKME